jgi:hypothetical protein
MESLRPRGAARSARLVVSEEIRGSNPLGGAGHLGTVRQPAERPSSNLGDLWVRRPPVPSEDHASAGHRRAQVAVTHPPSGSAGSTPARRTDRDGPVVYRQGHHPLKVEKRVRLPSGLLLALFHRRVAERQAREPQMLVPVSGVGVRVSPRRLREGRCPAEPHKLGALGSTPRPATHFTDFAG